MQYPDVIEATVVVEPHSAAFGYSELTKIDEGYFGEISINTSDIIRCAHIMVCAETFSEGKSVSTSNVEVIGSLPATYSRPTK